MTLRRFERITRITFLIIMAIELLALFANHRWLHAGLVAALLVLIGLPLTKLFARIAPVPLEVQFFFTLFIFATLFLGEVHDFYNRIWWWDLALHLAAGFLLGLLGFLVVYLLNEADGIDLLMRPSFIALFAFLFAVSLGALWEIFEFAMDQTFGTMMQKPMFDDPSGLTDTMWDLIVDTVGAMAAVLVGWIYIRRSKRRGTDHWLKRFVARHPRLFA